MASKEQQLAFEIKDQTFSLPKHILDFESGRQIVEAISLSRLRNKKNGNLLFSDSLFSENITQINPNNFQVKKENVPWTENNKYSSAVLILDKDKVNTHPDLLIDRLKGINSLLTHSAPLFVFEKIDDPKDISKYDKKIRIGLLSQAGFIKSVTKISFTNEHFLFWETRKKSVPKRKPINLFAKKEDGSYKYPWAHDMFQRIINMSLINGTEVLNPEDSELYKYLKKCDNAKRGYILLSDGSGLEYRDSCGCWYQTFLNGDTEIKYSCGEEGHPLKNRINVIDQMIEQIIKLRKIDEHCGICGDNLVSTGSIVKKYSNNSVSLEFITYCPHCGSDYGNYREKPKYLKQEEIVELWLQNISEQFKNKD